MNIGLSGFNFMFSFIHVIVIVGFVFVFGTIIIASIKGVAGWNNNNNSPILTVMARVVAKRADVRGHVHHNNDMAMGHTSSSTTYYTTFEVESGDRMELHVPDNEYGMLVEGDVGKLTFQGTRYKGFERNK